ncbi:phosphonate transport system substrate-binding protein [Marinobacter persicus]|uniref:Phosphonate transport system substrate-binding protein n=1 Tax=Marinobacter persicus TaxID=930118 RepID=A0A1I3V463_9GAMM|nr:phosphate/phosphite/phosphonate ABC transporter substrate-binding protein [Marinobacter persicus]GHD41720.1 phosphonates-binding protein [Marinobacter persicus]SFJ89920.1 phosphonate transport system substrate-binding protein [Marinobacter persicus]
MRWVYLLWLFLMSSGLMAGEPAPAGSCGTDRLVFSMIPKKDIDEQLREYQPLMSLLSEGLDIPVEMVRASSYQSVIDSLISGAVDVAVLGPGAYMQAYKRNPDIEAFASLAVEPGHFTPAGSFYSSVLIVDRDSPVQTATDLRGATVALTDPASTSGALIPKTRFTDHIGQSLTGFFAGQVYAGSHDKAMDALLAGKVQAAFVSSSRVDEYVARGVIDRDRFRVIWRSEPLHYDPFVFRSGLCDAVKMNIARLMTRPSEQRRRFLESQQATEITRVNHQAYETLEELLD